MQFKLSLAALASLVAAAVAVPSADVPVQLMSRDDMMNWLRTTDADLNFVGEPIPGVNAPEGLASRDAQTTMVTYCTTRNDDVCGGTCAVYNGGPTCINAPGTSCISATNNVGFCDRSGCGHSCNQLSSCGTHLDSGFCYTPGTQSILVGNY